MSEVVTLEYTYTQESLDTLTELIALKLQEMQCDEASITLYNSLPKTTMEELEYATGKAIINNMMILALTGFFTQHTK